MERNIENGMTLEVACYAATRSFGGVEQITEQCRDKRTWCGESCSALVDTSEFRSHVISY